jgi:PIN domain nuclease of toxin-antitoxin system
MVISPFGYVTGELNRLPRGASCQVKVYDPLDPMDRIIGATALDRGIPQVTRDKAIRKSKAVPVIW